MLALLAVFGQAAAVPLLACGKMAPASSAVDCHTGQQSDPGASVDFGENSSHSHHEANNLAAASSDSHGNAEDHDCSICVSCSTATSPHSQAFRAPQATPSVGAVYSAPMINNVLDSLFRPPISA